ncbi:alpha/beta fold hydrolase [Pelagibacterium luteolum]|uniref:Pimeloyl-ACP methyl ester carboxylesterase n=1 Tax=Pelagibacterium luteolum TaxID=440168 RepID=A0A1G7UJJ4_9HYPH|nr:alpha/beta hydrolase [Pelagibacterium luteolum]SDG47683.1 Pimeloyl-ACP methyl ester carboxylesterase [Pelagibacterium luteolum]
MTEPFSLEIDNATFTGLEAGEGIPVVFLHAGVCDSRMWESQIEAVASAGFWGVAYDRRGFGETHSPDEGFSHLEDLEAVLDGLGIHAAIVVGASMGGALAIDFTLANPERVAGLVLMGTSISGAKAPYLPPEIMTIVHAMEAVEDAGDADAINAVDAHAWLDGPLSDSGRVGDPVRALFKAMNGNILRKPKLTREEPAEAAHDEVGTIDTPALLVAGDLDFPHIVNRHDDLSEEMENAFAVVIEGTAHLPNMERPDLFNPLLVEFLATLTGEGNAE